MNNVPNNPTIKRVVFSGDFMRMSAGRRDQVNNIVWLQRQFGPVIGEMSGLPQEIRLYGQYPDFPGRSLAQLYARHGLPLEEQSWAALFNSRAIDAIVCDVQEDYSDALIVTFEQSPVLHRILSRMGVPFIDIGISPYRFMPDLVVSFKMSDHFRDNSVPASSWVDMDELALHANQLKTKYRSVHGSLEPQVDEDSLIFFSQSKHDRVLIRDGRFIGFEEALAGIDSMLGNRKLYVKPHPRQRNNDINRKLMDHFRGSPLELPTYQVLAMKRKLEIVTLASSVGLEAKVFGRNSTILYPDMQNWAFSGKLAMSSSRSSALWQSLLSCVVPVSPCNRPSDWKPNQLRETMPSWGFTWQPESSGT